MKVSHGIIACLAAAAAGFYIGKQKGHTVIARAPGQSLLPASKDIHLLVGIYDEKKPERMREFVECLAKNVVNPNIRKIHVFDESASGLSWDIPELASPKVILNKPHRRMTFKDYFAYANTNLAGCRVAIANTDIFFDESIDATRGLDLANTLIALSRYENYDGVWEPMGGPYREVSQDVWMFDAPMREFFCDFYLGKLGCDNRLAYEAHAAGMAVLNPYEDIRTYHVHQSQIRSYTQADAISGPHMGVRLSRLR